MQPEKNKIAALQAELTRRTGNPLAPKIIEDSYNQLKILAKMLDKMCTEKQCQEFSKTLTKAFPENMDHIAADPNFSLALASMLAQALLQFAANLLPAGRPQ